MAGTEEGIYASSKSVDIGTFEIDRGLTQPPKIQSQDALHAKYHHQILGDSLKEACKASHPSQPQVNQRNCQSNRILIDRESEPNDDHIAKRRRLAIDSSSCMFQGCEWESESKNRSPWVTLPLGAVRVSRDWQPAVEREAVSPKPLYGAHVSSEQEEIAIRCVLSDVQTPKLINGVDIKEDTTPTEGLVPTEDKTQCTSSISTHMMLENSMHSPATSSQTTHHITGCEKSKRVKTKPYGNVVIPGLGSWNRNVPLKSVEMDFQALEGFTSNKRLRKKSLPSRPSRAAAVAYGVSRGLLAQQLDDSKLDPLSLANHTFRNPRTEHDSSHLPLFPPQHSSVTTKQNLKPQQPYASEPNKTSALDYTIPGNLRVQFDALLKKYRQDVLFQKSVNNYIMELFGTPLTPGHDAPHVVEEASMDILEGKSLEELKSMYKRLNARFKSLSKVTEDMAAERVQNKDEIKYWKSMAKKIPDIEIRSSVRMKVKKPSDEMWVCNLDSKGGKPCGRKNSFYKQAIIWMMKKTCSGCRGHINNVREGFEYTKLAEVLDAHGLSDAGEEGYRDSSTHTSTTPQQSAQANPSPPEDPFIEMNSVASQLARDRRDLASSVVPSPKLPQAGPLRPSSTPTKQRFDRGGSGTPLTPTPQSARPTSSSPGSASFDSTYGHSDARTFIREARNSIDQNMPMFYDKRGMERLRAGLSNTPIPDEVGETQLSKRARTSPVVQVDSSSTPTAQRSTATRPNRVIPKSSASAKTVPNVVTQISAITEKVVHDRAVMQSENSAIARSEKVLPNKQLTETERLMVQTTNSVSEHFSGRKRKAWEGPAKYGMPKNIIEIFSDSDSSDSCDADSLFGFNIEHEVTQLGNAEQDDGNAADSEMDLGDLEEEIRAAFERDEPMVLSDDQAGNNHENVNNATIVSPFITDDRHETMAIKDQNELISDTRTSTFLYRTSAAAEESEESEEE